LIYPLSECNATLTSTIQQTKPTQTTTSIEDEPIFWGQDSYKPEKYRISFWELAGKTFLGIIVIGVLIFGIIRFFFKNKTYLFPSAKCINILATNPLSPNKYLQIIEIGNRILLIGVTDNSINLLSEITDKDSIDLIKLQCSSSESQIKRLSFIEHIKSSLQRLLVKYHEDKGYDKKLRFLKQQYERLKRLGE
jgi:flagellar protein FliO/FliZ